MEEKRDDKIMKKMEHIDTYMPKRRDNKQIDMKNTLEGTKGALEERKVFGVGTDRVDLVDNNSLPLPLIPRSLPPAVDEGATPSLRM